LRSATATPRRRRRRGAARRVLLIIENVSIARDHRARKQIATLLRAGYRVGVVCRHDPDNVHYERVGLRIYEYPAPPERAGKAFFVLEYVYSLLAAAVLMLRAVADGRFHAVQAGHPPDIYFLAALPPKLVGARFVVDQRDLSPEVYEDRFGTRDGVIPVVLRALEGASWRVADHIICVNPSLLQVVVTRGGITRDKVTVVGNGPVLASVAERSPDSRMRAGLPHLVCWVGVMGPQDHAEIALSAISHYVHQLGREDALFVFIGAGEALPVLRRLAVDLNIDEFVRFTGWLDEKECFEYLAAADLGLDSNLQPEVTPVKALEYMAHALPFVAFDLLETRALGRGAARYVAPGDAEAMASEIARLLEASAERRAMGRIGRERIEQHFAWDRQEDRYLAVYQRLIGLPCQSTRGASAEPPRVRSRFPLRRSGGAFFRA
jgi:glycosyltransferase involved in cell wall biosynthesis